MKRTILILLVISLFLFRGYSENTLTEIARELEKYNITWLSPSENEQGSMPLGNGDIGINAWAEKNGPAFLYYQKRCLD